MKKEYSDLEKQQHAIELLKCVESKISSRRRHYIDCVMCGDSPDYDKHFKRLREYKTGLEYLKSIIKE